MLKRARIRWFLSLDFNTLPENIKKKEQRTFRSITIEGEEIEFSGGFTDLHTLAYKDILDGKGFGREDARSSIETCYTIRNSRPVGKKGDYHPMIREL